MPHSIDFTDAQKDEIVWLYSEKGFTVADVARHMECSPTPIFRVLRDRDVPMRNQGTPLRSDRNQKILDMKEAGHSDPEIAKTLGVSKQRVNQITSRGY